MLPYPIKNTFDYENNCSYSAWRISLMNNGIEEKSAWEIQERDKVVWEIIPIDAPPRVPDFFLHRYTGKSIYEKKNRENYHGGKNEM
jgi:hypothetical protein